MPTVPGFGESKVKKSWWRSLVSAPAMKSAEADATAARCLLPFSPRPRPAERSAQDRHSGGTSAMGM